VCGNLTSVLLENLEMPEQKGIILPSQFSPPMLISLTILVTKMGSHPSAAASLLGKRAELGGDPPLAIMVVFVHVHIRW